MRAWWRLLTVVLLLGLLALGIWAYVRWPRLQAAWTCHQIGKAKSFAEAREMIRTLESGPQYEARLRDLTGAWGRGNQTLDYYLARYVGDPRSSEALRKAFSLELGWRREMLARWAHYRSWQAATEPGEEIDSITAYFDPLAEVQPAVSITWRQVLNLQAVFHWTGQAELAHRLDPTNWPRRYARWKAERRIGPLGMTRPEGPFPDWQGPPPDATPGGIPAVSLTNPRDSVAPR